jgi:hypothetical protein
VLVVKIARENRACARLPIGRGSKEKYVGRRQKKSKPNAETSLIFISPRFITLRFASILFVIPNLFLDLVLGFKSLGFRAPLCAGLFTHNWALHYSLNPGRLDWDDGFRRNLKKLASRFSFSNDRSNPQCRKRKEGDCPEECQHR